jgi:hypothetical protein
VGKTHVEKAKLKDRLLQAQAQAALEGLLPIVSVKWAAIDRNFAELDGYWYDLAMQLLMLMFYICTLRIWHPLVTLCHSSPL